MSNTNCTLDAPIRPLITQTLKNLVIGGNCVEFDLLSDVYSYTSIMATTSRIKKVCNCKFISQHKRTANSETLRIWKVA